MKIISRILLALQLALASAQGGLSNLLLYTTVADDANSTVFSGGSPSGFWEYTAQPCSACHPANAAVEGDGGASRVFYLNNTGADGIPLGISVTSSNARVFGPSVSPDELTVAPGSTALLIINYNCFLNQITQNNLPGWGFIYISINTSDGSAINVNYLKICTLNNVPSFDWSLVILLALAAVTVGFGSRNRLTLLAEQGEPEETLKPIHGLIFICSCSTILAVFYLFESLVEPIVTIVISVFALMCSTYMVDDKLSSMMGERCREKVLTIPYMGKYSIAGVLSFLGCLGVVIAWFITRNWVLNDILALCIVLIILKSVRLASLQVGMILLVIAFFYDIFWTLLSTPIFGQSIMASVATAVDLPLKIEFPLFTSYPYPQCSLLGLGDMVIPGLFVTFTYKFDLQLKVAAYYQMAMLGYIVGLLFCLLFLVWFEVAQPALLYIVPCMLGIVCATAGYRKEFRKIWRGLLDEIPYGSQPMLGEQTRVERVQSLQEYRGEHPNGQES